MTNSGKNSIINIDGEDTEWITVNGTPVPLKDGEMQGTIGDKIKNEKIGIIKTERNLKAFNQTIEDLKNQGIVDKSIGVADFPTPIKIESINKHAAKKMKERGIAEKEAQTYIDNAMIMFNQNNNSKRLYISNDGNSAVLVEDKRLISAYSSKEFDDGMKKIIEEVKKYE